MAARFMFHSRKSIKNFIFSNNHQCKDTKTISRLRRLIVKEFASDFSSLLQLLAGPVRGGKLRICSCLACVYRVIDARGKFGEHERCVRVARGDSRVQL